MHDYTLILALTGGLGAALVLGYITQRIGLSPIVGYLLAGTLVGPHTPGFVADASLTVPADERIRLAGVEIPATTSVRAA